MTPFLAPLLAFLAALSILFKDLVRIKFKGIFSFIFVFLSLMTNFLVSMPDSASMGAALRAAHGWLCNREGKFVPSSALYKDKLDKSSLSAKLSKPAGDKELLSKYALMVKERMEIEKDLVEKFGRS